MQRAQETRVEFGTACRIILNRQLTSGFLNEPARRHKRKRIQKKWLKRYGYKAAPDENIYYTKEPTHAIMMHPATFKRFVDAFLGDENKAAEAIYKSITGGNKA